MTEIKKIVQRVNIGHVISSENPEQFRKLFHEFTNTDGYEIIAYDVSTSAVLIGGQQIGQGRAQANLIIITSAYIEFSCTQEKADQYFLHQSLLLKK